MNQYLLDQLYLCYILSLQITLFTLWPAIVNKLACLEILPLITSQYHEKTSWDQNKVYAQLQYTIF